MSSVYFRAVIFIAPYNVIGRFQSADIILKRETFSAISIDSVARDKRITKPSQKKPLKLLTS